MEKLAADAVEIAALAKAAARNQTVAEWTDPAAAAVVVVAAAAESPGLAVAAEVPAAAGRTPGVLLQRAAHC